MQDSSDDWMDDDDPPETFVEGRDFYFEDGLMVLARTYLLRRGTCCETGCRNCPYRDGSDA